MKNVIYEVSVKRTGKQTYRLQAASDDKIFERLSNNPVYDETICQDIGWTLNKECVLKSTGKDTYSVLCYAL